MPAFVLQIAYDQALLELREIILRRNGYEVISTLGNKEGIERAQSEAFDVIVVGFCAPAAVRKHAIREIKQSGKVPVIALLAHEHERFPEADCATLSEDPESWLAAVAGYARRP